jgi:uncharacterized protein (DUF697 family)
MTDSTPGGDDRDAERVEAAVVRLTEPELEDAERRRLLRRIVESAGSSTRTGARRFLMGPKAAVRWALDSLVEIAPHLPVRDLETLRRHHDGKTGDLLAEALIRNASRVTMGIGTAGGGLAAVQWVAPPALLTAPVLIAAETTAVVAVEVKLIAELHEAYGMPVRGTPTEKGSQLLGAWAQRRGVSLLHPGRISTTVLGVSMRKELRDRLVKRMGRNLTTIGPFLTGAAVAAELNRRATRSLGEQVREDLRRKLPSRPQLPPT